MDIEACRLFLNNEEILGYVKTYGNKSNFRHCLVEVVLGYCINYDEIVKSSKDEIKDDVLIKQIKEIEKSLKTKIDTVWTDISNDLRGRYDDIKVIMKNGVEEILDDIEDLRDHYDKQNDELRK